MTRLKDSVVNGLVDGLFFVEILPYALILSVKNAVNFLIDKMGGAFYISPTLYQRRKEARQR